MRSLLFSILLASSCAAAAAQEFRPSNYHWQRTPVGNTADLLTLFCRSCNPEALTDHDVPLIAVLKDTLGDSDPENDHLSDVWLLTYSRPSSEQRIFSAVPFFFWHVGRAPRRTTTRDIAPLINLSAPEQPTMSKLEHDVLQWAVFDPMANPIRAASRSYRVNQQDDERLHLEEAISYLRDAPVSEDPSKLTRGQLDTILARLELRKHLLGGFANERRAAQMAEQSKFAQERIRIRNWELLRQCADKTGLIFESLDIAGSAGRYGMLWFPLDKSPKPVGLSRTSIWKLLNIKDPWHDPRLQNWKGITFKRSLDENGSLLPVGDPGVRETVLVPLGVYSFNYPKQPLLLVDFRDTLHARHHEMMQRAISELVSGVLGLSHFTNWYCYLGLDLYEFVVARHGTPEDQGARLDSYAQFRVELALDHDLDPVLRREMECRIGSVIVNPLVDAPEQEIQGATVRYAALQAEAKSTGRLITRLDAQRRSEIGLFGKTTKARITDALLNRATFGLHHRDAKKDDNTIAKLDCFRRIRYYLNSLDSVVEAGTQPEIAYDRARLHASVSQLSNLVLRVQSPEIRVHTANTLQRLGDLSRDATLQADCRFAIALLRPDTARVGPSSGIVVSVRTTGRAAPSAPHEFAK